MELKTKLKRNSGMLIKIMIKLENEIGLKWLDIKEIEHTGETEKVYYYYYYYYYCCYYCFIYIQLHNSAFKLQRLKFKDSKLFRMRHSS